MAEIKQDKRFFMKLEKIPSGTAQQRRFYYDKRQGVRTYPSESYRNAKKVLTSLLREHRPLEPYKGAVLLDVEYRYETKEKRKHDKFKTTKPDGDNLLKVLKDCMTQLGFYADDAQVCVEAISRYWVEPGKGGIRVHIAEISDEVF